jgi:nucleotide-binding universal stress UspA family protein
MTILVGMNFSPSSEKALAKALDMARLMGGKIHLLHVLEPVDDPESRDPETQRFYLELEQRSQEKLDRALDPHRGAAVEISSSIRIGPRHVTILQVANELEAELVVLGSHPMSEDSQRIGTSHRVAVTSSRTVVLVP